MDQCKFTDCNQTENHPGPHGIVVPEGIIFAPYGNGADGRLGSVEDSDIPCDCCQKPMPMRRAENGGGVFKCTACNQEWTFSRDGSSYCTTIARLYPAVKPGDKLYLEAVKHNRDEYEFKFKCRLALGLIDEQKYQDFRARLEESYQTELRTHNDALQSAALERFPYRVCRKIRNLWR